MKRFERITNLSHCCTKKEVDSTARRRKQRRAVRKIVRFLFCLWFIFATAMYFIQTHNEVIYLNQIEQLQQENIELHDAKANLIEEINEISGANDRLAQMGANNTTEGQATALRKITANTRLQGYEQELLNANEQYGVDINFIIAVARFENCTTNVFGFNFGGDTGYKSMTVPDAIDYFCKLVSNPPYADKTIDEIARIYCPPNHEQWSKNVKAIMSELKEVPL
jgi:cell division protein FtsB